MNFILIYIVSQKAKETDSNPLAAQATKTLLEKLRHVDHTRLHALLHSCFHYVGIPQLRPISVAVLSLLQPVPKPYLEQLAEDNDFFWELPLEVQRQVRLSCHLR